MFDLIAAWFAAGLFAAGAWIVIDSFGGRTSDRPRRARDLIRAPR